MDWVEWGMTWVAAMVAALVICLVYDYLGWHYELPMLLLLFFIAYRLGPKEKHD